MALITGTSGNDSLIGTADGDNISGLDGNDSLFGGVGQDFLSGGLGDDFLDGGTDSNAGFEYDSANYGDAPSGVNVSLLTGSATGGGGNDTLINIENLYGSNFDDVLTGNAIDNQLHGGSGNDTLIGGAGYDLMFGGLGDDLLDGGADFGSAGYGDATSAVTVSLLTGLVTGGGMGNDTLIGINNVGGSKFNDLIIGATTSNYLSGEDGDDTLIGGNSDDVLFGGYGSDSIVGGNGIDRVGYGGPFRASGVNVNLMTGLATSARGTDSMSGIENVSGTFQNDVISGDVAGSVRISVCEAVGMLAEV